MKELVTTTRSHHLKIDQIRAQYYGLMISDGINKVYEYYKEMSKELSILKPWLNAISRN